MGRALAYSWTVLLHSWLRWAVILTTLMTLVGALQARSAGRAWTPADRRSSAIFVGMIDLQVLLGLVLYVWLSPVTDAAFKDFKAAMHDPQLRFFAVEHITSMFIALIIAHTFSVLARRGKTPKQQHGRLALGAGLALLCFLVGMPWPFLAYGRPLMRGF